MIRIALLFGFGFLAGMLLLLNSARYLRFTIPKAREFRRLGFLKNGERAVAAAYATVAAMLALFAFFAYEAVTRFTGGVVAYFCGAGLGLLVGWPSTGETQANWSDFFKTFIRDLNPEAIDRFGERVIAGLMKAGRQEEAKKVGEFFRTQIPPRKRSMDQS